MEDERKQAQQYKDQVRQRQEIGGGTILAILTATRPLLRSLPGGEGQRAAEAAKAPAGGGGGGGAAHGGGPAEAAEGAGGGQRGQRYAEPRGGVAQEQTQVGGRRR